MIFNSVASFKKYNHKTFSLKPYNDILGFLLLLLSVLGDGSVWI